MKTITKILSFIVGLGLMFPLLALATSTVSWITPNGSALIQPNIVNGTDPSVNVYSTLSVINPADSNPSTQVHFRCTAINNSCTTQNNTIDTFDGSGDTFWKGQMKVGVTNTVTGKLVVEGSGSEIFRAFDQNANEVFTITDSGFVGIGTTTGLGLFHSYAPAYINEGQNVEMNLPIDINLSGAGDTALETYLNGYVVNQDAANVLLSTHDDNTGYIYGISSVDPNALNYFAGEVGLGTSSPTFGLSVGTSTNFTKAMNFNGNPGTSGMILKSNGSSLAPTWVATSTLGITGSQWVTSGSNIYYTGGNVGIGSTTPAALLGVNGAGYFGGNLTATGTLSILDTGSSTFSGSINSASGNLVIQSNGLANAISLNRYGGNVGIGATSTPSASLSVVGPTNIGRSPIFTVANLNSVPRFTVLTGGNVGIGTTTPNDKLDITGRTVITSADGDTQTLAVDGNSDHLVQIHSADDSPWQVGIYNDSYSQSTPGMEYFIWSEDSHFGYNSGDFEQGTPANTKFGIYTNGYTNVRLTIDGSGNVGIGSTSPIAPLVVVANSGTTTIIHGSATHPSCDQYYSANGTVYKTVMSNAGVLTTTAGTCP